MTSLQKYVFEELLKGGSIALAGTYRLRDRYRNPLRKLTADTCYIVFKLCRRKNRLWIIDLRLVRSLHGNHFVKKAYKQIKSAQTPTHAEISDNQ